MRRGSKRMSVATAGLAVGLLALASLASATQDIANDGMAAEHFRGAALARINAIQVGGVMVGFFAGGAGTLILSGLAGQRIAFLLLACVPLVSLVCVIGLLPGGIARLPDGMGEKSHASLLRFAKRPFAFSLLLLALLSAMTTVSGFGLSKLFLNDTGWSLDATGRLGMADGGAEHARSRRDDRFVDDADADGEPWLWRGISRGGHSGGGVVRGGGAFAAPRVGTACA